MVWGPNFDGEGRRGVGRRKNSAKPCIFRGENAHGCESVRVEPP